MLILLKSGSVDLTGCPRYRAKLPLFCSVQGMCTQGFFPCIGGRSEWNTRYLEFHTESASNLCVHIPLGTEKRKWILVPNQLHHRHQRHKAAPIVVDCVRWAPLVSVMQLIQNANPFLNRTEKQKLWMVVWTSHKSASQGQIQRGMLF